MRFLGEGAAWNHIAMEQAIQDSGLEPTDVSNIRTGIIMGSGGPSARTIVEAADITRTKGPKRVGPFAVPKAMSSTASATLATWFKIKGVNYSISSACATSNHCIGNAYETIQIGKQDIIFAGGCEELEWSLSVLFDAMGAMSSKYNDTPATASRPYDISRDGFVIAGGAGVVVLEELEHAKARGAKIYGEIIGYGATSDGYDMVAPSGEGAERCMRMAMEHVKTPIDYINPHATSTPAGDPPEIEAIRKVFGVGDKCPPISATKALTGHSLGATGVQEAIYSLLMMQERLHLRKRQHHRARSCVRRHADRAQANRQCEARHRAVEFLRLRRHQRHAGVQADGCVISFLPVLACGERSAARVCSDPKRGGHDYRTARARLHLHDGHPVGCARNVYEQTAYVLIRGCSGVPQARRRAGVFDGNGLASRIVATFAGGAETIGVSLEREPAASKTASAGWYKTRIELEPRRSGGRPSRSRATPLPTS